MASTVVETIKKKESNSIITGPQSCVLTVDISVLYKCVSLNKIKTKYVHLSKSLKSVFVHATEATHNSLKTRLCFKAESPPKQTDTYPWYEFNDSIVYNFYDILKLIMLLWSGADNFD